MTAGYWIEIEKTIIRFAAPTLLRNGGNARRWPCLSIRAA
jgi:hypothetical protein